MTFMFYYRLDRSGILMICKLNELLEKIKLGVERVKGLTSALDKKFALRCHMNPNKKTESILLFFQNLAQNDLYAS